MDTGQRQHSIGQIDGFLRLTGLGPAG